MAVNSSEEKLYDDGEVCDKELLLQNLLFFGLEIVYDAVECQNVQSVVVLADGDFINHQYELPSNISNVEVPNMMKSEMCLNSEPNLLNHTNLKMDKVNNNAPCILDVDIEKGTAEISKSNEEFVANLKSDDSLVRALQREIWLQIVGKFMQLLMNHGTELPKFTSRDKLVADRVNEMPTNRFRKYKRSHSFNSRRVVLMFSILSSMGTMILIYLTLRVRQLSEGPGNI
ncbi:hypothetical protein BUALT_Bualt11G0017200 [Buddleja alternifolia]|uniref:Uncharacterized protein n=1 Tax=Buddleja alternifolia TaxID=168488 RepID=A0AAV6WWQ7_9LAMI|nr:hypothetical protein BUALT_Bualt11G0017200 [Buddleja alternifolia]